MAQINKPTDYFNTKLYTGNGSTNNITGISFQPDWVWIKHRNNSTAYNHRLYDVVRGVTKNLASNETDAEITSSTELTSFDSDGFTLGSGNPANQNTINHVAWNWKAGGTASSNTDGSITSSVSANTTSGFSIVSFTGTGANATVGHGLSSTPKMVIFKNRDNGTQEWDTYHAGLTDATYFIQLNSSNAPNNTNGALRFNSTAPTSSVFSVGTATTTNESGSAMIAYCFSEVKGFSKIGKYRGNSSSDGVFVYLGFKPAMVMVKSNATEHWEILDNKRSNSFNAVDGVLFPSLGNAEETTNDICDFLSNGIKFRHSDGRHNSSSHDTYFMAFAESPLVGTNNIPAVAR